MIITANAKRYAKALFELAQDKNYVDAILNDFHHFLSLIERDKDLQSFVKLPNDKHREQVLSNSLQQHFSDLFFNFLLVVLRNKRFHLIPQIYYDFENRVDLYHHRIRAIAITAVPLTKGRIREISHEIGIYLNATVRLENEVDPSLLGGIILKLDGKIFNASLAEQFKKLKYYLIQNQK